MSAGTDMSAKNADTTLDNAAHGGCPATTCSPWVCSVIHGDCMEIMSEMPDKSIDAIITDPPYAVTACEWDIAPEWREWWANAWRICKGPIVMTATNPFAAEMIMNQRKNFKHDWVWDKRLVTGGQNSQRGPMRAHELVLVFAQGPLAYNPQKTPFSKEEKARMRKHDYECTNAEIIGKGKNVSRGWYEGKEKLPTSVLRMPGIGPMDSERQTVKHPTQKPLSLMRYLVATYTNPGDTVMDCYAGSGTTLVACKQTGRQWIGIEKNHEYAETSKSRLAQELAFF